MKLASNIISLSILTIAVLAIKLPAFSANSTDLIDDCFKLSQNLGYEIAACQGHFDAKFYQNISHSSLFKKEESLQFSVSLRKLGYLDQSLSILKNLNHNDNEIMLAEANLNRAMFLRSQSTYKAVDQSATRKSALREAADKVSTALNIYYRLSNEGFENEYHLENAIIAALNWVSLCSELDSQIPELSKIKISNLDKLSTLLHTIDKKIYNLDKSKQAIARINLAEVIINLNLHSNGFLNIANTSIDSALSLSNNDLFINSKCDGLRGRFLELTGYKEKAIDYFEKAASSAEFIRHPELAYQWNYHLAKLYAASSKRPTALIKYEDSITDLENIRKSSISLKTELQYEFRDKVEPIYREYLEYLFYAEKPDLQKIVKINELLQIGELENYLQCGNLGLKSLLDLSFESSPDSTIYVIRLPKVYAVILKNKDGSLFSHFVEKKSIDILVKNIHLSTQSDNIKQISEVVIQDLFQRLNNLFISPLKSYLPKKGTLVFALDSNLQNIPWSLLYDGQHYLIEKYSIAYAFGSRTTQPKLLPKLDGLIGGVEIFPQYPSFSPLPNVDNEIKDIEKTIAGSSVLLNKSFTEKNLLDQGQGRNFIHLATHGQFSSDPEDTFILGWDTKISLRTIQQLIRSRSGQPLELLVLSACSTAEGDNRATLGIAGTAIQAGARSIVASLWTVDDASQVQLMQNFYTALKDGHSKADALRFAQLKLMRSDKFNNPYYYGGIILVGSWL